MRKFLVGATAAAGLLAASAGERLGGDRVCGTGVLGTRTSAYDYPLLRRRVLLTGMIGGGAERNATRGGSTKGAATGAASAGRRGRLNGQGAAELRSFSSGSRLRLVGTRSAAGRSSSPIISLPAKKEIVKRNASYSGMVNPAGSRFLRPTRLTRPDRRLDQHEQAPRTH